MTRPRRLHWNPYGLLTLAALIGSAALAAAGVTWLMISLTSWAHSWGAVP